MFSTIVLVWGKRLNSSFTAKTLSLIESGENCMKAKLATVLVLMLAFSLLFEVVPFRIPAALSSPSVSSSSVSLGVTQTAENSINITGNLVISGNEVVRFSGVSSSAPFLVSINGNIEVTGNGALILEHTLLFFIGSQAPYDRYIRLSNASNGHPRLIVLNSTINCYTSIKVPLPPTNRTFADVSFGGSIYAYGNSTITANGFSFYRNGIIGSNINAGGLTRIRLFGSSSANLSNVNVDSVQSFDDSSASITIGSGPSRVGRLGFDKGIAFDIFNNSRITGYSVNFNNVTVHDRSSLSLTSSTQMAQTRILAYDLSTVQISTSSSLLGSGTDKRHFFGAISAFDNSSFAVISSSAVGVNKTSTMTAWDYSTISVYGNASIQGKFSAYNSSSISIHGLNGPNSMKELAFEQRGSSSITISNCLFSRDTLKPPEFRIYDNSVLSVINSTINFGWFEFHNGTSLHVSSSTIDSSELVLDGNASLMITKNSNVSNALQVRDNSFVQINSSLVEIVYSLGNGHVSLNNGTILLASIRGASSIFATNSTIDELLIVSTNATGSLASLTTYYENADLAFPGSSVTVNLVKTYVLNLDLLFLGDSNVAISDSVIRNLSLQGNSVATLTNVSTDAASLFLTGKAEVNVWSSLRVRSVDYFGNPLSGSNVTIETGYASTAKVVSQGITGQDGWVTLTVFSAFVNASGTFPFGDVTVRSRFGGVFSTQTTSLGIANKEVVVSLPLPSWSGYIIPVVIIVAIIAALVLSTYVYARIRKSP